MKALMAELVTTLHLQGEGAVRDRLAKLGAEGRAALRSELEVEERRLEMELEDLELQLAMTPDVWGERYPSKGYDGWRISAVRARGYREMDATRVERLIVLVDKAKTPKERKAEARLAQARAAGYANVEEHEAELDRQRDERIAARKAARTPPTPPPKGARKLAHEVREAERQALADRLVREADAPTRLLIEARRLVGRYAGGGAEALRESRAFLDEVSAWLERQTGVDAPYLVGAARRKAEHEADREG